MKRICPLLAAVLLLLVSCAHPTGERAEFDAFTEQLDAEKRARSAWTEGEQAELTHLTASFKDQLDAFSEEELQAMVTEPDGASVDAEGAAEDIEVFFRLLRTTYGGYEYFGGDEVFVPIRDSLIEEAVSMRGHIRDGKLGRMIREALSPVIVDRHFRLDGRLLMDDSHERFMFYVPDLYFDSPAGLDPDYVKRTIGADGALTYCFAALAGSGSELPEEAVLHGETIRLDWRRAEPLQDGGRAVAYRKEHAGGLTVLVCRTMTATGRNKGQLERLASSGASYRGRSAFAVDLRGNRGGNDSYGAQWVEGFTGTAPCVKGYSAQKCSPAYLAMVRWSDAYAGVHSGPEMEARLEWLEGSLGTWQVGLQDGQLADNDDSIIFVLTDRETSSAGEGFAHMLASISHVVLVGSNTNGCLQFGNVGVYYLPNSGLSVQMGSKISFYGNMEISEGVGILPDLWVDPSDALNAVKRLCAYYGL